MSAISFINPSAEQQQAVTSLIAALEAGHTTTTLEGSLLFDVLDGKEAELVFDGATSGREGSLDATIYTENDEDHLDIVEVAKVRITVEVVS